MRCTPKTLLWLSSIPPVLPSPDYRIMQNFEIEGGTLQVSWIPQLETHGLFFTCKGGPISVLATHTNEQVLLILIDRIRFSQKEVALGQVEYIRNRGGMVTGDETFNAFFNSSLNTP